MHMRYNPAIQHCSEWIIHNIVETAVRRSSHKVTKEGYNLFLNKLSELMNTARASKTPKHSRNMYNLILRKSEGRTVTE